VLKKRVRLTNLGALFGATVMAVTTPLDVEVARSWMVAVDIVGTQSGCSLTLTHEIPEKWASYAEPVRHGWMMVLDTLSTQMETKNG